MQIILQEKLGDYLRASEEHGVLPMFCLELTIHVQESKKAAREKVKAVVAELLEMKLKEAAKKVEDSIEEVLFYYDFPSEYWPRIRTNNIIERLNRET